MLEGNNTSQGRDVPVFAQERQEALTLLQEALEDKENFIKLKWGPSEVNWPNPTKLRDVLSTHKESTYKDVLEYVTPDKNSQEVRALAGFYLRMLRDEDAMERMEVLEGRCNLCQDITPLLSQMQINSHLDAATPTSMAELLSTHKVTVLEAVGEIDKLLSLVWETKMKDKKNLDKVVGQTPRQLYVKAFWREKCFSLSREDLLLILIRKPHPGDWKPARVTQRPLRPRPIDGERPQPGKAEASRTPSSERRETRPQPTRRRRREVGGIVYDISGR